MVGTRFSSSKKGSTLSRSAYSHLDGSMYSCRRYGSLNVLGQKYISTSERKMGQNVPGSFGISLHDAPSRSHMNVQPCGCLSHTCSNMKPPLRKKWAPGLLRDPDARRLRPSHYTLPVKGGLES